MCVCLIFKHSDAVRIDFTRFMGKKILPEKTRQMSVYLKLMQLSVENKLNYNNTNASAFKRIPIKVLKVLIVQCKMIK